MKLSGAVGWTLSGLMLPQVAQAIPLSSFIDTSFIGGGVMLFIAGFCMLFIPRMFKLGVLIMLLADALFLLRIFFRSELSRYLEEQTTYAPFIQEMSRDASRFYTVITVLILLTALLLVRSILRQLFGREREQPKLEKRASPASASKAAKSQTRPVLKPNYPEETLPPPLSHKRDGRNNRFRVHDYLEQLERQQEHDHREPR
ncbi:MAG: hypothetical protein ACRCRW_10195 [Aeromonadaceae bacterium]